MTRTHRRLIALLLVSFAGVGPQADAASRAQVPLPRPRPVSINATSTTGAVAAPSPRPQINASAAAPFAVSAAASFSSADTAAAKRAISAARKGKVGQATEMQAGIKDPVARKTVEWVILRSDGNGASSSRYIAFITANPTWPSIRTLRRRAEAMLFTERRDPAAARAYFAKYPPLGPSGHFAYAWALLAQGDRTRARAHIRDAWHNDNFSASLEARAMDAFGGLITAADHKARMDMRLYAEDIDGGLRSAKRAGGAAPAIAKARIAVIKKARNAKAALDAVPSSARRDLGYIFSLAQWLRRNDRRQEAGDLILSIQRDASHVLDTDQWWIERRLTARHLLDLGDAAKAYRVARDAVTPKRGNYRAEHQFTAGWIALRFLNDPPTAMGHFSRIPQDTSHPISLARAGYWLGRTYEALGESAKARAQYQKAARHSVAYYG
ncbi:MAG: lytic transglycosylase domain-containing protein, partial [Xanthobacteraceae bacterium]